MYIARIILIIAAVGIVKAYKSLIRQKWDVAAPTLVMAEGSSFSGSEKWLSSSSSGGKKRIEPSVGVSSTEKFLMMYTCKICDGRNAHMVSKVAYEHGMVVTTCRHCKSRHLIADNERKLDMGPDVPAFKKVEELLKSRGERVKKMQVDPKEDLLEGRYIVEQDGDNINIVDMQVALDEKKQSERGPIVANKESTSPEGDGERRMRFITRPVGTDESPEDGPAPSNE